jgi:aryl sulfotransferase
LDRNACDAQALRYGAASEKPMPLRLQPGPEMAAHRQAGFCAKTGRLHNQFRQQLPGWSGHVASWLDQNDIPVHLVRYEDMQADAFTILRTALDFAGRPASDEDKALAVGYADFAELRK